MKRFIVIAAMIAAFGLGGAAAFGATSDKPPSPPGQDECEHGNSQKPCKEDPQPDHGADCDLHGKQGGVNEDHCAGETTTTTTETTSTETTSTETTSTETTSTGTTSTETTTEDPADEEEEQQVFTPPAQQVVSAQATSQSGPTSVAKPDSATKPTTAAQAAPYTP